MMNCKDFEELGSRVARRLVVSLCASRNQHVYSRLHADFCVRIQVCDSIISNGCPVVT